MSQICEITGIRPLTGNRVSNSNRKTKRRQLPNLKIKRYFVPQLGRSVSLTLSTRAIRSIEKVGGISNAILQASPEKASTKVQRLQSQIRTGK